MLVISNDPDKKVFTPKRFNSPLYAVYALMDLQEYEFILFRGKGIQRLKRGFRAEITGKKWSRVYAEPLHAIREASLSKQRAARLAFLEPEVIWVISR